MKHKVHYILLLVSILFTSAAFAQVDRSIGNSQYKRTTAKNKDKKADFVDLTVKFYTKELKLDDFQQAAVRAIMEEQREPINDLMADKTLINDERRDKGKAINDRIDEKMKPILSPDQLKKYTELQEKRRF